MTQATDPEMSTGDLLNTLFPVMGVVAVVFLIIGAALPILPIHVRDDLGLGTFVVGLVAGSQFASALVSRYWAGRFSDTRGAKVAVVTGLVGAIVAGGLYLLSMAFFHQPVVSVSILIAGRGLLGGAESFIMTGSMAWGLQLVDARYSGRVISWIGTAMYVAFAAGAPLGAALNGAFGFGAIALATALIPLAGLAMVLPRPGVASRPASASLFGALGYVWLPGLGLALSSIGLGAVTTFSTLLFVDHGWSPSWLPFSAFAIAFVIARIFFGHLPDKFGGARIALVFVLLEAAGQALMWSAQAPWVAIVGAVVSGLGYSLVFPSLGLEAVRRSPAESRGLAMGAYTAFLDLALGVASPLLGLLAAHRGVSRVFLTSASLVAVASLVSVALVRSKGGIRNA